jgi:serine/threonine protein kinase
MASVGIIHRDLKPGNLLLRGGFKTKFEGAVVVCDESEGGELVIADLGLARYERDCPIVGGGTALWKRSYSYLPVATQFYLFA